MHPALRRLLALAAILSHATPRLRVEKTEEGATIVGALFDGAGARPAPLGPHGPPHPGASLPSHERVRPGTFEPGLVGLLFPGNLTYDARTRAGGPA